MARESVEPEVHLAAMEKANWCCERCGVHWSTQRLELHHVMGRQPVRLVNCADNVVALCRSCHSAAHANKPRFLEWFANQFGDERLCRLYEIRRGTKYVEVR